MGEKERFHIFISGRVQGVRFREGTLQKAQKLGVFGWVKNIVNGQVEAIFEGEKEKVEKIVNWAKRGPIFAKVSNIEINQEEYKAEFSNFEIRYEF